MKKVLVIGSLNMDFSIKSIKLPLPGETVIGESFKLNPGGKGANCAYALGKLGCNTSMIGMVGNDTYAKELIHNLKSVNVNTNGIKIKDDISTGVAFVNVDSNGENNIIVIPGANNKITTSFIDENITLIKEADIIVMQLEIPADVVMYIARLAKEYNKFVVLDPAPAINNLDEELYKYIDIIKPNETELAILTNSNPSSKEEIIKCAKILNNKGVKNVIVTLGGDGSILVNNDCIEEFKALDVDVVDTTAAGDSFTAALICSLSRDKSLDEAISFAHTVSAMVVTKRGAQSSIPTEDEIRKFIEGRNL